MEDNSPSDEEIKDSPVSPKQGGKKLKLNDGSSQDSLNEGASASTDVKEDNVDSGLSADKSESTCSEERGATSNAEPLNEVVTIAPSSSSNVRAILLNIRRPRHCRNYRKRKTPDRDSDGNSSRDSDDFSAEERPDDPYVFNTSGSSPTASNYSVASSSSGSSMDSSNDYSDDNILNLTLDNETDSDEGLSNDNNDNSSTRNRSDPAKTPSVLLKTQPKHNYMILREVINREMGLTFPRGKTIKENVIFEQKFCGSLHVVQRLAKLDFLSKHRGCVNSINFHPEGHLLASGSDDTNVIVWDWARNKPLQVLKTGHKSNVFQSKFLHLNSRAQLNIATCARDGQIRLLTCPSSGGAGTRRKLGSHSRAAHKLLVSAHEPHVIISAGEDAIVLRCDVREQHASKLMTVRDDNIGIPLYSVAGNPLRPRELLVAGRDKFLRVYDTRRPDKPMLFYTADFDKVRASGDQDKWIPVRMRSMLHLTCAVYNYDGSEILGSYNDEDIYLFDAKLDVYDKDASDLKQPYSHKYSGHRNSATFKGVSFFGPKSEYIVSGSDCAHIYIWEKHSEAIVQWAEGDQNGVVNCIEPHPRFPIMATSGLDKDIKIWMPRRQSGPDFNGLEKIVRSNAATYTAPMFTDFLPTLYNAWRGSLADEEAPPGNLEFDGNACTTF
ncbi:unnamed protein product [Colias eurytheme]|nr:unnamed protein product [Colias eurytheme]